MYLTEPELPRPNFRQRRALLGAGIGALGAVVLGSLSRASRTAFAGGSSVVNGRVYEGEALTNDFPDSDYMTNKGGSDGAGMCVMTSIEMCGRWAGVPGVVGLRDWCARQPGGGYPQKVDQQIAAYFKAKGQPAPAYIQYEGPHPEKVLLKCMQAGLCAAMTYGYSPRYSGRIAHMTVCPHFSGRYGVCMDNNLIGGLSRPDHLFEWMSAEELLKRIKSPSGEGWVFAWCPPQKSADGVCRIVGPFLTFVGAEAEAREMRREGWETGQPYAESPRRWYFRACR